MHEFPSCFGDLYSDSEANDLGLSLIDFSNALLEVGRSSLATGASAEAVDHFYRSIHIKDFALAQACAIGSAAAWKRFLSRYQGRLYAAALVIARNESEARELADSLAGDLFGDHQDSRSKLASYKGRGTLDGWLKVVLARSYIDLYRSKRTAVSLEQRLAAVAKACCSEPVAAEFSRQAEGMTELRDAVRQVFLRRTPEERFLLAAYFFDDHTLAEIARLLHVHESIISRRIKRLLKELRHGIKMRLIQAGMSQRQIDELLQTDVRDIGIEIRGMLMTGFKMAASE